MKSETAKLKFATAKFWDAEVQNWAAITPNQYREDVHHGRLECPDLGCHGALSFVSAGDVNGGDDRSGHFRTNKYGQLHEQDCALAPDPTVNRQLSMEQALKDGYAILLNVNFPTSYNKERARLEPHIARKAMPLLNGFYRPDWKRAYRDRYAPYSGTSQAKLVEYMRDAYAAADALGLSREERRRRIFVCSLHAVLPWGSFYLRQREDESILSSRHIFYILRDNMQGNGWAPRFWSAGPALLAGLRLRPHAIATRGRDLHTTARSLTTLDGRSVNLRDTVRVHDPALRQKLQLMREFSVVATPHIERTAIEQVREHGGDTVHLLWPVTSLDQVVATPPRP